MDVALTRLVWQRAKHCCEYCQLSQQFDDRPFEIDHIISRKHQGAGVAGNLALSCFRCNSFKEVLNINDPLRVELREALLAEDLFPPN
jgi:5-methylcytosine-specific restriction endonuclease McrA